MGKRVGEVKESLLNHINSSIDSREINAARVRNIFLLLLIS